MATCRICGREFQPTHQRRIYCSRECTYKRNNGSYRLKTCKYCGAQFGTTQNRQIYCSPECRYKNKADFTHNPKIPCPVCGELHDKRRTLCRKCYSKNYRGPQNPNWKGGRLYRYGYIKVYKPEHPRADYGGYIWEHWDIWEKHYGKILPDGWVIHHINGIKTDNRIENLLATPAKNHHSYLPIHFLQKHIKGLEAEIKQLKAEQKML